MLLVLAVMAAAAAWREPSPCGRASAAIVGRSVVHAAMMTPLPLRMKAPSSLAISFTESPMESSRMFRSFSV